MEGVVCRIESKDYYVLSPDGNTVRCSIRGRIKNLFKLKKDKLTRLDVAAVGDKVSFSLNADGTGVIEEIFERKNYFSRKAPRIKGGNIRGERFEQIIAANIDKVFATASAANPKFNNRVIDRILVAAESGGIEAAIIINKIDLDENGALEKWKELYGNLGYEIFLTDAVNKIGTDELKKSLRGFRSAFFGQSGVGKSSVLNAMYPSLNFKVGQISDYSLKGKHTTVTSALAEAEPNTFVIDTPGVREVEPFGIKEEDLGHYYREFEKFIYDCKFNTCTHSHEPGCAVIEAARRGEISAERYRSYLNLLETIESDINF